MEQKQEGYFLCGFVVGLRVGIICLVLLSFFPVSIFLYYELILEPVFCLFKKFYGL